MNICKLSIILAAGLAWSHGASGGQFQASLTGAKVSPAPTRTSARGQALFNFKRDFSRASVRLKLRKADGLGSVHLHCAPAGGVGPVIADLLGGVGGGWHGNLNLTATLTSANLDQAADCAAVIGNPILTLANLADAMARGQIYVDVPSAVYPGGEIRGQLEPASLATFPIAPPPTQTTTSGPATGTVTSTITQPRTGISAISTPTAATLYPNLALTPVVQRTTLPTYFNPPCPSSLNPQCSQTSFNPPCPSTFGAPCSTDPNPAFIPVRTVFPFTTVTTVSTTTFR
jgi:hypothetical protein